MASPTVIRLSSHGPTLAAAAAAAMATAAASSEFPGKGSRSKAASIITHIPASKYSAVELESNEDGFWDATKSNGRLLLKIRPAFPEMNVFGPHNSSFTPAMPQFKVDLLNRPFSSHASGVGIRLNYCSPSRASLDPSRNFQGRFQPENLFSWSFPKTQGQNPLDSARSLHSWSLPSHGSYGGNIVRPSTPKRLDAPREEENTTSVVLLGWLGSQQKHLKKYVEWYNQQGMHAVTFVLPMSHIFSVQSGIGSKAEEEVDLLVAELERWLELDSGSSEKNSKTGRKKTLVFHTFSNTGWLLYGAVLKRLIEKHGADVIDDIIKGSVIDSAPVLDLNPKVWASGFCTALLKKQSQKSQIKGKISKNDDNNEESRESGEDFRTLMSGPGFADIEGTTQSTFPNLAGNSSAKSPVVEKSLRVFLESFFSVFLKLPVVNKKLSEITKVLEDFQPSCPQMYIYSSSDQVIPPEEVENFAKIQRTKGKTVFTKKLEGSPHVDHFRTFPEVYSNQLHHFFKACLP